MTRQAVILAGGKGTRLQPYTTQIPKPLVSVGERPIIEILLRRLKRFDISDIRIAVNHLAHLIAAVLGDGTQLGLNIEYSLEDTPLSTIGPLKLVEGLDDTFVVANGDIISDIDFTRLVEHHAQSNARLTVATHQRLDNVDYGVFKVGDDGFAVGFEEKPTFAFTVSMGIYVFSRSLLEIVPDGVPFGFDELVLKMLETGEPVNTYPFDGYWLDVGRPDDYEQAKRDIDLIESLID